VQRECIFDKRGFAYLKPERRDAKMERQGAFRQVMAAAQKGVKQCGPATRQLLKETSTTATWHGYLMKNIIGPQLYILAAALYDLGLYADLGRPGANAEVWRERVMG
jgi:hypothetical protein